MLFKVALYFDEPPDNFKERMGMNFFWDLHLWLMIVVIIIGFIALFVFYWMTNKQKDRRTYYTDRFEYILNELLERLRKIK